MKLRNIFLISLLLIVLTVGAVSATSDFNETVGDSAHALRPRLQRCENHVVRE